MKDDAVQGLLDSLGTSQQSGRRHEQWSNTPGISSRGIEFQESVGRVRGPPSPGDRLTADVEWSYRVDLTALDDSDEDPEESTTGPSLLALQLAAKKRWQPTETASLIALAEAAGETPDWPTIDQQVGRLGCKARYATIVKERICASQVLSLLLSRSDYDWDRHVRDLGVRLEAPAISSCRCGEAACKAEPQVCSVPKRPSDHDSTIN